MQMRLSCWILQTKWYSLIPASETPSRSMVVTSCQGDGALNVFQLSVLNFPMRALPFNLML
jgi:hypothetical protein